MLFNLLQFGVLSLLLTHVSSWPGNGQIPLLAHQSTPSLQLQTFKTEPTLHPPLLSIQKSGPTAPGYLFISPFPAPVAYPLITTDTNDLIYIGDPITTFGFGVQTYKNQPVLVYWSGVLIREPVGRGYGSIHILDQSYEQIAEVKLPGDFQTLKGTRYESNVDAHEIYITEKGTMLVTANNVTQYNLSSVGGPKDGWTVDSLVYEIEIESGEVVFRWSSVEHIDEVPLSLPLYLVGSEGYDGKTQEKAWGYFHINAAKPYEDGFIISSRYLCAALMVNRDGSVEWILQGTGGGGDFTVPSEASFCYQHDIRASNITTSSAILQLHDNANCPIDNGTHPTSGLILSLDFRSKTATLIHRYLNPSNPIYASAQGSFQLLPNGNVFLGHGVMLENSIEEFSPAGEILMTASIGEPNYRAFRQPWTGTPKTLPKVYACASASGTSVWMSWNGATEVGGWRVYGGEGEGHLQLLAEVGRSGFETHVELGTTEFVQVETVGCGEDGNGRSVVQAVEESC